MKPFTVMKLLYKYEIRVSLKKFLVCLSITREREREKEREREREKERENLL